MVTIEEWKAATFKSYYVVWKPALGIGDNFAFFGFKSYYVVWKLRPALTMKNTGRSLNRTM